MLIQLFTAILEVGNISMLPNVEGDMSMWFDSFLQMVDLLMNMIHFTRTGNWDGYMETLFEFLPYCFALNRHNYARNLSFFHIDMTDLEKSTSRSLQTFRRLLFRIVVWSSALKYISMN